MFEGECELKDIKELNEKKTEGKHEGKSGTNFKWRNKEIKEQYKKEWT